MSVNYYSKLRYNLTKFFDECTADEAKAVVRAILHFDQNLEPVEMPTEKARYVWSIAQSDLVRDATDRQNGAKGGRGHKKEDPEIHLPDKTMEPEGSMVDYAMLHGFTLDDARTIGRLAKEYDRITISACIRACDEHYKIGHMDYFMGCLKNLTESGTSPEIAKTVSGYTIH